MSMYTNECKWSHGKIFIFYTINLNKVTSPPGPNTYLAHSLPVGFPRVSCGLSVVCVKLKGNMKALASPPPIPRTGR